MSRLVGDVERGVYERLQRAKHTAVKFIIGSDEQLDTVSDFAKGDAFHF